MKKYFIFLILFLIGLIAKAQDPNWSVNTSGYQYSMTFTTFLSVNGTTLSSTEDKVGAFVNGETRGVANVVYVASAAKYVAYLSVFSNTSGETISFKIFDSTNDTVVDVAENQDFAIDGNVGGILKSYSIASPVLSNEVILNSFTFSGITNVSQSIANSKIDIVLPSSANLTNLIAEFSISNNASFFVENTKQVSGTTAQNFTSSIKYHLLSENEAVFLEYDVTVTLEKANVAPPEIVLKTEANINIKQAPLLIQLETNVPVLNFTDKAILLVNAVVSSIKKGNDLLYTLEIVPIQQGGFSVEIPENALLNADNEGNSISNKLTFKYDLIQPYLLSIKKGNPSEEITQSDTLEFTVVFSEAVDNVFSTSFESVSNATFVVVKESDATYLVTVRNIENYIGAAALNLKATNTIQDKAGNLLLNSVINVHQN
ncbi:MULTISPECIES: hypothetical protein [unclassified Polaribacter]|uniref:hypothetical protein n=1 Tax=unclassified Polaribacter TaxID=196858 RepID=UPI0011BFDA32|nr:MULTISPECIES: hypothetical protein [unclassified Polaribacter]TXD51037.1 hypothetical protein ES043_13735 [Polaribacter sp. IC063]TXD62343.1 hypothetical protein ES044_02260 [Polaribacter sp. IC066]